MKKVNALPVVGSVGDKVVWDGRVYEKMKNGRWGPSLTTEFLSLIERLYCDEGRNLREVASAISLPGHPIINHSQVQNICNAQNWMRSHYGQGDAQRKYITKNTKALRKAIEDYGVPAGALSDALNVKAGYLISCIPDLRADGIDPQAKAKIVRRKLGVLSTRQMSTWNSLLTLDVQSLTWLEYRKAVRRLTSLVLIIHHDCFKFENGRGLGLGYDNLDHKVTLFQGYWTRKSKPTCYGQTHQTKFKRRRVLSLSVMCHPSNLHVIDQSDNCSKRHRSSMSTKELEALVAKSSVKLSVVNEREHLTSVLKLLNLKPFGNER